MAFMAVAHWLVAAMTSDRSVRPLQHLLDAVLAQRAHAGAQRRGLQFGRRRAVADAFAHGVVGAHQLVQAEPAAVAVVVAVRAALAWRHANTRPSAPP
jgi:hypothetical protein